MDEGEGRLELGVGFQDREELEAAEHRIDGAAGAIRCPPPREFIQTSAP